MLLYILEVALPVWFNIDTGYRVCRVGLVEVLLGLLDWRAGGRSELFAQMKWNESEASIGRVLAIEVRI